jgi:3-oxoacyl-[acyl-carrier-protein] synthase II
MYKTKNACEVDSEKMAVLLEGKRWRSQDRTVDMALLAAEQALGASGLLERETDEPIEMATVIGTGDGPPISIEASFDRWHFKDWKKVRPTTVPRCMINIISSQISMKFGLGGANYVIASACSSSTNALGVAYRMVKDGYNDRVMTGGAECFFTPGLYAAWDRLGVMSRNPDAKTACRPFDADRDGFLMGEGAAMMVLESLESALSRGVRIRGEIAGYGETSDADHLTRPSEEGQARAMRAAMESAGVGPGDIAYINAHGTATAINDVCETRSVRMVLGDAADNVPVGSNKSFFGHLLGGVGATETAATLLALESGVVAPNLNLDNPDPECTLNLVGGEATPITGSVAMKNSFGFGGGNAVLILKKYDGTSG